LRQFLIEGRFKMSRPQIKTIRSLDIQYTDIHVQITQEAKIKKAKIVRMPGSSALFNTVNGRLLQLGHRNVMMPALIGPTPSGSTEKHTKTTIAPILRDWQVLKDRGLILDAGAGLVLPFTYSTIGHWYVGRILIDRNTSDNDYTFSVAIWDTKGGTAKGLPVAINAEIVEAFQEFSLEKRKAFTYKTDPAAGTAIISVQTNQGCGAYAATGAYNLIFHEDIRHIWDGIFLEPGKSCTTSIRAENPRKSEIEVRKADFDDVATQLLPDDPEIIERLNNDRTRWWLGRIHGLLRRSGSLDREALTRLIDALKPPPVRTLITSGEALRSFLVATPGFDALLENKNPRGKISIDSRYFFDIANYLEAGLPELDTYMTAALSYPPQPNCAQHIRYNFVEDKKNTIEGIERNRRIFRPQEPTHSAASGTIFDFALLPDSPKLAASEDVISNNVSKAVVDALRTAQVIFDFGAKEVAIIIMAAIKNGGLASANQDALAACLGQAFAATGLHINPDVAYLARVKSFSHHFQKKMEEGGIFTGNPEPKKFVGMRLKRLTPEYALSYCQNADFFAQINRVIDPLTPTSVPTGASAGTVSVIAASSPSASLLPQALGESGGRK
jgi:hypothetical protein